MLLTPSGIDFQAGRTVTIIADGETGRVPFALLVLSDGHFLGETVPLVNVRYGAAGGAAHHIGASTPVLLAANAHAYSNGISLPPLPDAEREVAALGERFTAPTVLRGGDLTADRLEAEAPRAALFHFAGHGVAPAGNGALIMAGGAPALLTAARVARMDWSRCALVALATCLSAAGELDGIANPESLVRAFLTAGAQSVLASGWQVDSAAASDFFNAFYRSLLGGAPVEQAAFFAGAQLRSNPRYRHPRYWAAFQLYE
jgi:CHAT domain-containing protein